jgi:cystathionine gamma-lyase
MDSGGLPIRIEVAEGFAEIKNAATIALHTGHEPFEHGGIGNPVIPPITLSTTFQQRVPGEYKYDYSRADNYSREILEKTIAALEKGSHCITFGSGLAATNGILHLLKSGDHIVCFDDVYGGTNRLFRRIISNFNVTSDFVDLTDASRVEGSLKPNTKIIWLETPSNPMMKLVDIADIVKRVRALRDDVLIMVDNTFMSSYFQNPLEFGADMVLHSLTKYMNGHTDVVMGAVIVKDEELAKKLHFIQYAGGAVPSPFDCYLVLRGLRTLALRMREHMRNGLQVARYLEKHPLVEKVIHPGLPSHPQYELGKRQMKGYSGMVSIYIKGGREEMSKFVSTLKIFALAESLGGYESLVDVPSLMTHASVPEEQRAVLGITDNLVRLSVGIEDCDDLIHDLEQALAKTVETTSGDKE